VLCLSQGPWKTPVWESIAAFQRCAGEMPIVVTGDGSFKNLVIPPGLSISGTLPVVPEGDLLATARRLIGGGFGKDGAGKILSLQGVKGGVGVSTTAVNLETQLAGRAKTILVEMRPGMGTLQSYFRPRRKMRTMTDLTAIPAQAITAADLADCLWPCQQISGLSILFSPGTLACDGDW